MPCAVIFLLTLVYQHCLWHFYFLLFPKSPGTKHKSECLFQNHLELNTNQKVSLNISATIAELQAFNWKAFNILSGESEKLTDSNRLVHFFFFFFLMGFDCSFDCLPVNIEADKML